MENIEKRVLDLQRAISLGYVNLQEALGFDYRQAIVPILKQHIQVRNDACFLFYQFAQAYGSI